VDKVIIQHPTGNANVRAAAIGFAEAEILGNFYTTIATFPNSYLDKLSSFGPFSELKRRGYDALLESKTHSRPCTEIGRIVSQKYGLTQLTKQESGVFSIDAVYRDLDRYVSKQLSRAAKCGVIAVYSYEDGALSTFRASKELGLNCLYDLPIGYWRAGRRLLSEEKDKWPEWGATLNTFIDSDNKLNRKDEELRLADTIFVASSFTAETLKDFPGQLAPIRIIPYGFPQVALLKDYSGLRENKKLKLLFVGNLSQRKGIANLFSSVNCFYEYVELTVVGKKINGDVCLALDKELEKHNWISSLPHHKVLELMRDHDVLVFPSLFEGFGLVITEAMSQGMPVITTERTIGPDIIEHGRNGWLISAGSAESIKEALEVLIKNPQLIASNGKEARETALARPWSRYSAELSEAVANNLIKKN